MFAKTIAWGKMFGFRPIMPALRRRTLRFVPPLAASILGRDQEAIRRPLMYAFDDFQGPSPDVWKGPIFIHVPKAAGSSILNCGVKFTLGHKPISFYLRHKPNDIAMPYTFAIVRNPLARYISAFYFLKSGGLNAHDQHWADRNIDHDANHNSFAENLLSRPKILRQMHFRPQVSMLLDKHGVIAVDRILRFESLDRDWGPFARQFGLSADLPRTNANPIASRTRAETTPRCREIISFVYRNDFEMLNFNMPE